MTRARSRLLDEDAIFDSVENTGRLVVVDEATPVCGMAADVVSRVCVNCFDSLTAAPATVTARTPRAFQPEAREPLHTGRGSGREGGTGDGEAFLAVARVSESIHSLSMPKWGMTMTEGTLVQWRVQEGDEASAGDEVAEVETEKMNGPVEVQVSGMLRRRIAAEGDVIRVGGMLAVIAPADASDEEIDAFVVRETAARTAADTVREPPRAESVSTSLGPVRALVLGDGPEAAVFLHGFGGDALNWRFNIEELHGARRNRD